MDYSGYTDEELMLDESFQNWVKEENAADIAFWELWIVQHPEKEQVVEKARHTLLQLHITEKALPEAEIKDAWQHLQQALQERKPVPVFRTEPLDPSKKYTLKMPAIPPLRWYAAAAVSLLIIASGFIYILLSDNFNRIEKSTAFGETATVSLPDGSQVVLNGHTFLKYNKTWDTAKIREVWLEGEAYFSVTKQNNKGNSKFIVHTPDLDIEVLGTQFNVSKRKDKTRVVLNEGKVKINTSASKVTPVCMKPGELVEFSSKKEAMFKMNVNPEIYSSWKNKRLIFENTSLQEIAEMIESTYGLQVNFENQAQTSRKLSGVLPTDNIDILLLALSSSFNITIEKNDNQLLIKANPI